MQQSQLGKAARIGRTRMEVPRLERKLVAILAADVAGYSRLMEQDEVATLEALSAHRVLTDSSIERFNGRITGTAGDSVLAEFASVVDAVDCAVEMQRAVAAASENTPPERRLLFRIGINVGDVMMKDGDIFGDGVNVAARLESLADPGGICVSRGVRDHLRKHSTLVFEDLGEQSVKNIAQAIRAFRVRFDGTQPAQAEANDGNPAAMISDAVGAVAQAGEAPEIELAFWASIKDSEDGTEFAAYLERYPAGAFSALAESRLHALEGQNTAAPTADPEAVAIELAFWDSVKDSASEAELRAYLDRYPSGSFVALARARLQALAEHDPPAEPNAVPRVDAVELAFWDSVKNSDNPAMLEAYLAQFASGSFVLLARARLDELRSGKLPEAGHDDRDGPVRESNGRTP